jgi:hypothetical protein
MVGNCGEKVNGSSPGWPTGPLSARDAARLYYRDGDTPIPVPFRSKAPSREGWRLTRYQSEVELDAAFPEGVASNVGSLNGEASGGQVDVDLDCPRALAIADHFLPPSSRISGRSACPYSHRWYRLQGLIGPTKQFRDLDGGSLVELRSTGTQTLKPPSSYPDGDQAVWYRYGPPTVTAYADLLRHVSELAAATILARHWPAEGSRQDAAMALAGGLARAGWAEDRILHFVESVAVAAGDPDVKQRLSAVGPSARKAAEDKNIRGWPSLSQLVGAGAVDKARTWLGLHEGGSKSGTPGFSAENKGSASAAGYEPLIYKPFPVELLPSVLREFVEAHAKAKACDPALIALPALAACAGAVGNSFIIKPKWDWAEPCVLWLPTVGESGDLKSPPYKAAVRPLVRLQMGSDREYEKAAAVHAALDKKDQVAQKKAGQSPGPRQSFYITDATVQAVAVALRDRPKGCLLAAGELRTWFESFTRFAPGGVSDQSHWLEMFDAGDVRKIRVGGDSKVISIPSAAVSITGTIQPGIFAKACTQENAESGLLARLWPAMPPPPDQGWTDSQEPTRQIADYAKLLETLLAQPYNPDAFRVALRFSADAQKWFVEWVTSWARRRRLADPEEKPLLAKLKGGAARLALLHHLVTCLAGQAPTTTLLDLEVSRSAAEAGTRLAEWFAYEAWRVYQSLYETPEEREVRQLLDWIGVRGGRVTGRDVYTGLHRRYPTADKAEAALQRLVAANLGHWEPQPPGPTGGRATLVFVCGGGSGSGTSDFQA